MIDNIPKDKQVILFDGVCNLCNSSVLYVIKRDKKNKFLFAPLQSEIGNEIIEEFKIDTKKTDSILLFDPINHKIYHKSSAALRIANQLNYPTKLLSIFFIIPTVLRDLVYNYIAKNRYKWFGRKDACMIPTPDLQAKFMK
ncbi:thiol-disulfide oxidoreductase DCC family protein [Winogradskyella sp. A2]|uniref:thiol-disulfide oxidoreductase DCC family protein n=1 Tax=Winogradskyella sp. A2 TaxID=3366944 RepID=UPI00398C3328